MLFPPYRQVEKKEGGQGEGAEPLRAWGSAPPEEESHLLRALCQTTPAARQEGPSWPRTTPGARSFDKAISRRTLGTREGGEMSAQAVEETLAQGVDKVELEDRLAGDKAEDGAQVRNATSYCLEVPAGTGVLRNIVHSAARKAPPHTWRGLGGSHTPTLPRTSPPPPPPRRRRAPTAPRRRRRSAAGRRRPPASRRSPPACP